MKVITTIVVITFTLNSSFSYASVNRTLFGTKSHAQRHVRTETEANLIDIKENPSAITIPSSYGQIVESYKGRGSSLLVHIQDCHVNELAQLNIARILKVLAENYDIRLLSLEGASKRLDTTFYNSFADGEAKEKISRLFVKEGLFTGPEYFKIINKGLKISAFGAEDRRLYIDHLKAYQQLQPDKEEILTYLDGLDNALDKIKKHIYSEPLKELQAKSKAYRDKAITLAQYASYLHRLAKGLKIKLSLYTNFKNFIQLVEKEKRLDFKKAEEQRQGLIDELTQRFEKEEMARLLRLSLDFRLSKISAIAFYGYLEEFLESKTYNLDARDYKALLDYIDYLKLSAKIEHFELFDEIEYAEEEVSSSLFKTQSQKTAFEFSKSLALLKDLYSLRLTHKRLDYIDNHPEEFDITRILGFIRNTSNSLGEPFYLNEPAGIDIRGIKAAQRFYRLATERDIAIVENTLKRLPYSSNKTSVVVTGGFHTSGITNILKEKEISYVVICPVVGAKDCEKLYRDRMEGIIPDYESLLKTALAMLVCPLHAGDLSVPGQNGRAQRQDTRDIFTHLFADLARRPLLPATETEPPLPGVVERVPVPARPALPAEIQPVRTSLVGPTTEAKSSAAGRSKRQLLTKRNFASALIISLLAYTLSGGLDKAPPPAELRVIDNVAAKVEPSAVEELPISTVESIILNQTQENSAQGTKNSFIDFFEQICKLTLQKNNRFVLKNKPGPDGELSKLFSVIDNADLLPMGLIRKATFTPIGDKVVIDIEFDFSGKKAWADGQGVTRYHHKHSGGRLWIPKRQKLVYTPLKEISGFSGAALVFAPPAPRPDGFQAALVGKPPIKFILRCDKTGIIVVELDKGKGIRKKKRPNDFRIPPGRREQFEARLKNARPLVRPQVRTPAIPISRADGILLTRGGLRSSSAGEAKKFDYGRSLEVALKFAIPVMTIMFIANRVNSMWKRRELLLSRQTTTARVEKAPVSDLAKRVVPNIPGVPEDAIPPELLTPQLTQQRPPVAQPVQPQKPVTRPAEPLRTIPVRPKQPVVQPAQPVIAAAKPAPLYGLQQSIMKPLPPIKPASKVISKPTTSKATSKPTTQPQTRPALAIRQPYEIIASQRFGAEQLSNYITEYKRVTRIINSVFGDTISQEQKRRWRLLLLGTVSVETYFLDALKKVSYNGSGRYQMTGGTANDIVNRYIKNQPELKTIFEKATNGGVKYDTLTKMSRLELRKLCAGDDDFCALMALLTYMSKGKDKLPSDVVVLSRIWKDAYNTSAGKGTYRGARARFLAIQRPLREALNILYAVKKADYQKLYSERTKGAKDPKTAGLQSWPDFIRKRGFDKDISAKVVALLKDEYGITASNIKSMLKNPDKPVPSKKVPGVYSFTLKAYRGVSFVATPKGIYLQTPPRVKGGEPLSIYILPNEPLASALKKIVAEALAAKAVAKAKPSSAGQMEEMDGRCSKAIEALFADERMRLDIAFVMENTPFGLIASASSIRTEDIPELNMLFDRKSMQGRDKFIILLDATNDEMENLRQEGLSKEIRSVDNFLDEIGHVPESRPERLLHASNMLSKKTICTGMILDEETARGFEEDPSALPAKVFIRAQESVIDEATSQKLVLFKAMLLETLNIFHNFGSDSRYILNKIVKILPPVTSEEFAEFLDNLGKTYEEILRQA